MSIRRRPSVCARSLKIGPAETEVLTGTPPWKLNVAPLLAALIGTFATLTAIEFDRKLRRLACPALSDGTKWSPCATWLTLRQSGSGQLLPDRRKTSSTVARR